MTKTTRLVMFDELNVIRLVCREKDCHTIVEFNLEKIRQQGMTPMREAKCPGCKRTFQIGYGVEDYPLYALADAIHRLRYMHDNNFEVQFPLDEAE